MQIRMKLIGCDAIDFKGLDSPCMSQRSCGPRTPGVQPQKPIYVQVRVRQYADVLSEVRRSGASNLKLGPMPVGTMLDCYV